MQTDGRILLGGQFTRCSGVTRSRVTRLNPDGTVDPTINFGAGANDFVAAIAVQQDAIVGYPTNVPDEKIIIGGGFSNYNGDEHQRIARIYGGSIVGPGNFQFSSGIYQTDEVSSNAVITVLQRQARAVECKRPRPGRRDEAERLYPALTCARDHERRASGNQIG